MSAEEFQCISELGKHTIDTDFKTKVVKFFWDIICNADQFNYKVEEVVNNCISKFAEMVKYWDVKVKAGFFTDLAKNIKENRSSIPCIKLFKQLIKDQKDRQAYSYTSNSNSKIGESGSSSNSIENGGTNGNIVT